MWLSWPPGSALVTFRQFVAPAVVRLMGGTWGPSRLGAEAGADYRRRATGRTEFVPARLENYKGRLTATPHQKHGSSHIADFARAEGLASVPVGSDGFVAGDRIVVAPLRNLPGERATE